MRSEVIRIAALAGLLAGGGASCVAGGASGGAPSGEEPEVGAAPEALVPAYCILGAHTDDWTVHFQGPSWLVSSTEALGPQDIDVRVQHFVQPALSASGTFQLDKTGISSAVGYNVAELVEVIGGARRTVPSYAFERLEAYVAYQRTIWEIHDANCGALLGTGASFRPIGVFFRVINATDTRIPDTDVILVGPDGVEPLPVGPIGPAPGDPPPEGGAAAGAPADAGAPGDVGAATDAGGRDGG